MEAVPGLGIVSSSSSTSSFCVHNSKKNRKPYTITKSRECWTEHEHDKFLHAIHLFDRDWKKVEGFVGSKTVIQIRSHAQKYFLKIQKNGTNEHLPPPRPKRKATHPYPHKASKGYTSIRNMKKICRNDVVEEGIRAHSSPVLPDFGRVYNFIGSMFDTRIDGHLQKLKTMDPIDLETVLLLMTNLSGNLARSPSIFSEKLN